MSICGYCNSSKTPSDLNVPNRDRTAGATAEPTAMAGRGVAPRSAGAGGVDDRGCAEGEDAVDRDPDGATGARRVAGGGGVAARTAGVTAAQDADAGRRG